MPTLLTNGLVTNKYLLPHIEMKVKFNGYGTGLVTKRLWVQFLVQIRQVVHTYVPLSPSHITWYWPWSGDALWLGSLLKAWQKLWQTTARQ